MAIPVARVHLAMAHAALPGLLPTPPRCTMLPLLPAPPCAVILPSPPPRPSRAEAARRWDAHKTNKQDDGGGSPAAASPSATQCSLDRTSSSPRRASTCESWVSNRKKSAAGAATSSSSWSSGSSVSGSSCSWSSGRADSEERWDAHKKPASPAPASASSSARSNKKKTCRISSRRPNSRMPCSSAERWDAHKKPLAAPQPADELDDGESSTGSNDVELLETPRQRQPRSLYAGPDPSMLPLPSLFMTRVKLVA